MPPAPREITNATWCRAKISVLVESWTVLRPVEDGLDRQLREGMSGGAAYRHTARS